MPQNIYIYDPNTPVPEDVQYVEIPQGMTGIRENAFRNCFGLQSVVIPDSVTEIGKDAFYGCSGLQSVTIPDSVTKIGSGAFSGCSTLQSVTIPDSITEISDNTFRNCSGLQSVTIPDSVKKIGAYAFQGCPALQSVAIPDGVTEIGRSAFYGCAGLRSVTVPGSVTGIEPFTFYQCSGLQSITIPDSITEIGHSAFCYCRSLQSFTIPDSVTTIGEYVFMRCDRLQSITIPDGITEISTGTFSGCARLHSAVIPDSVKKIGNGAFSDCSALQTVTIPDGVDVIEEDTFFNCIHLRSITIPDSVTMIGDNAFEACTDLQSITIPDSVANIGNTAFRNCSGLQSVVLPNGITEIGIETFYGCFSLQSVTIPDSVTEIMEGAFGCCSNLQSVTIPDSVTDMGESVFQDCTGLRSVAIPDRVTIISAGIFAGCAGLQSVTIPDSVTEIGNGAFGGCTGLRSVTIPGNVTEIGRHAFFRCTGLQSVTIRDGVVKIDGYAFGHCTGLQSVTIPDSVTEISNGVFINCSGLQSVTLPDSIATVQDLVFRQCTGLQSLIYKGINIAPVIDIDGYGVNIFNIVRMLTEHRIPLNENTVRLGIGAAHQGALNRWIRDYPTFGEMRLATGTKHLDEAVRDRLRRCFTAQKKTGYHVPKILEKLAMTACICRIPPERLAEMFDVRYTEAVIRDGVPVVPAEACRCYYDRGTCDMLIRKNRIAVMAEAISLYNKSGHRECYKHLMDFILSHSDTKIEDLRYATDHAEEMPMRAGMTLAQVRQHRIYLENRAEVEKIEAVYGKIVPGFKLADYPCSIDPVSITYDGMTARVLDLSDDKDIALAARLGELTGCCQRLYAAGETAMMHGFLNPDAGFWVIEDKDGKIRAQAEIWKTDNGNLVFDNIEFADTDDERLSDRAEQFRGIIAAWAMESGYRNIVMGCGFNELGTNTMEQAPIPKLRLTPEEVFALQEGNDANISFGNIDEVHRYMRTTKYRPDDFVYTDTDKRCVYIKKDGIVSDYLMQGYDCALAEKYPASGHGATKEQSDDATCK